MLVEPRVARIATYARGTTLLGARVSRRRARGTRAGARDASREGCDARIHVPAYTCSQSCVFVNFRM